MTEKELNERRKRRDDFAMAALEGIIAKIPIGNIDLKFMAKTVVQHADAVIAELDRTEKEAK